MFVTDSLTELKGSSSYSRKKAASQDGVPKFSLSDVSDDDMKSQGSVQLEELCLYVIFQIKPNIIFPFLITSSAGPLAVVLR